MVDRTANISIPMPWGFISGKTFGQEQTTPVLCVHGRSDNLESFSHLLPLLPPNNFYVCIDLPGHGKSSHAHKGYILDVVWYTMAVKRVLDHFKWSKIYYLGHSLGGQIGFILSALYPELVLKLIIIDTLMFEYTSSSFTARALREDIFDRTLKFEQRSSIDQGPTYSLQEFMDKMKEIRHTESNDEHLRLMAERNLIKVGPDQYKYSNDQRTKLLGPIQFTFDQLENIASRIQCPTLLVLGKNSTATRPLGRLSRSPLQKNRHATFRIIDGDHDVHMVHSQEVANIVRPFLSEVIASKL